MGDADSPEALEAAIARYNEAWNAHDLDAIMAMHAPDMVFENHTAHERAEGEAVRGHIGSIFETWPDIRFDGRRTYCRDGLVVQEWTATATHANEMRRGDLVAEPTGKVVTWDGLDVIPFEDGLVKRKDVYSDSVTILSALGLLYQEYDEHMVPVRRGVLAVAFVCGLLGLPGVASAATTTTAIASNVNPSVFGQQVTFTATVSPSDAVVPTGTVTFSEGATTFGTVTVAPGGGPNNARASLATSSLPASAGHTIKAQYNGDPTHGASSGTMSETVNKANSAVSVSSDHAPSVFGQPVTFTATIAAVAPGGGTPAGNVTFSIDGTPRPPVATSGGKATFTTSSLTVPGSPHTVGAAFVDTAGNHNNSAGALSGGQTVNRAQMAIAVESSLNPAAPGETVTLTAIASGTAPSGGTPTGTVSFFDGSTPIGTAPLSGGRASVSTSELGLGNHSIVVTTAGDSNFNPGVGGPLTQSVETPPAPPDPVVPDTTPPTITDLGLTRSRFAAARKTGTKVRYTLSEAATVTFTVEKSGKGRRPAIGRSFTAAGVQGPNSFKFRGRIGGKRLAPGRYSLTATGADAAGNVSPPQSVRFRIVRSARR